MEGMEEEQLFPVEVPQQGVAIGPDPFDWLSCLAAETLTGPHIAVVLYSMYRSTTEFGHFIDDMPHLQQHHVFDGNCFKCALKELQLTAYTLPAQDKYISYFAASMSKWESNLGSYELLSNIHDSIEAWANLYQEFGFRQQFNSLFRFATHKKWGCYHCKYHFSEEGSEYMFDTRGESIHQFLHGLTTEIRRRCSRCMEPSTGYDRVTFSRLPHAVVFVDARSPLADFKLGEATYKLNVIIPDVHKGKCFVFQNDGWIKMNFKRGALTFKPLSVRNSWTQVDYVFYTRIG